MVEPLVGLIFVSSSLVVLAVLSFFPPPQIKTEKAVWSRETMLGETSEGPDWTGEGQPCHSQLILFT